MYPDLQHCFGTVLNYIVTKHTYKHKYMYESFGTVLNYIVTKNTKES